MKQSNYHLALADQLSAQLRDNEFEIEEYPVIIKAAVDILIPPAAECLLALASLGLLYHRALTLKEPIKPV